MCLIQDLSFNRLKLFQMRCAKHPIVTEILYIVVTPIGYPGDIINQVNYGRVRDTVRETCWTQDGPG